MWQVCGRAEFGAAIALGNREVRNTKLLEEKDHEAHSKAGKKGKDARSQEARKESPPDGSF
jgi:hypothetical protein